MRRGADMILKASMDRAGPALPVSTGLSWALQGTALSKMTIAGTGQSLLSKLRGQKESAGMEAVMC